jgi:hypothetical protein
LVPQYHNSGHEAPYAETGAQESDKKLTEERTYVSWKEASKDVISSRAMRRWLPNISAIISTNSLHNFSKFGKIIKKLKIKQT